jgi:hypothetical protein
MIPIETKKVRVLKLHEQDKHNDLRSTTPAQRLEMMWQLTLDAWAFKGEPVESEFRRNVVRVIRPARTPGISVQNRLL